MQKCERPGVVLLGVYLATIIYCNDACKATPLNPNWENPSSCKLPLLQLALAADFT